MKLINDLGITYSSNKSKNKSRFGIYECPRCGSHFKANTYDINREKIKSCGCLYKNLIHRKTHNLSKHRLYKTWKSMKDRCHSSKDKYYKDYGGRGIKVCDRWLDISNFIEDMYPTYQEGLTLDRVDVNGNYEPDNCRWATNIIQSRNTKDIIKTNKSGYRGVTFNKKANKWKAQIKVNHKTIYLGYYHNVETAAKAYETYVRVNNLEHNFTPILSEEEIKNLENNKQ